jgi:hypothetical protein
MFIRTAGPQLVFYGPEVFATTSWGEANKLILRRHLVEMSGNSLNAWGGLRPGPQHAVPGDPWYPEAAELTDKNMLVGTLCSVASRWECERCVDTIRADGRCVPDDG